MIAKVTDGGVIIVEVPNMEGMFPEDLDTYAAQVDKIQKTLSLVYQYAIQKAAAMRKRAGGQITEAIVAERLCEGMYRELPESLRW